MWFQGLSDGGSGAVVAGYLGPVLLAGGGMTVSWILHDGGVMLMVGVELALLSYLGRRYIYAL
jgi:hypothetical protein